MEINPKCECCMVAPSKMKILFTKFKAHNSCTVVLVMIFRHTEFLALYIDWGFFLVLK